ncbi:glycosyltransferase [Cryobacterium sp. W22_MBD10_FK3]|uniref:glycosyltransferase n=1 Tax=Cryobacterium sp. W22_MBD10_FK3 TaxID=3240273 RepID=UPI003F8FF632
MAKGIDVLMITHRRPDYVRRSLPALLASADENTRVWLWHNGDDTQTLEIVQSYYNHPAVYATHHSEVNAGIRVPTNWMWENSDGDYVSKVDDDCIVDPNWIRDLRALQESASDIGVVASWRFYAEDFEPSTAMMKVQRLPNGRRIMRNHWVQGSGYLAKREALVAAGPLRDKESFPDWCLRVAREGYRNGWAFPFIHEEHMDDPRSPYTIFSSQEKFDQFRPLHAKLVGIRALPMWTLEQHKEALTVQGAPLYIYDYFRLPRRLWLRSKSLQRRLKSRWPLRSLISKSHE